MDIKVVLEKYGLETNEAGAYLSLLQLGTASVAAIAHSAVLKRPTVYRLLDSLLAKGLISKVIKDHKVLWTAEHPAILASTIDTRAKLVREAVPFFQALYRASELKPRIKFYEGKEGVRTLLFDSIYGNSTKEVLWIWPMTDAFKMLGEAVNRKYIRERIQYGIHSKNIRPKEKEIAIREAAPGKKYLREVRFSPPNVKYSVTVGIYGNKVSVFSSEKEHFGFLIESIEYTEFMKQLFWVLWQASSPAR